MYGLQDSGHVIPIVTPHPLQRSVRGHKVWNPSLVGFEGLKISEGDGFDILLVFLNQEDVEIGHILSAAHELCAQLAWDKS